MGQGDLDGSDGGAYRPLPVSIWGSLLASKVGFPTQTPKLELLSLRGPERSPMVDLELT